MYGKHGQGGTQIKMAIYTIPNATEGMDKAIIGIATTVPVFVPMLLVFVWIVVFLGGSNSQRKRNGTSDMPMWSVMASLSVLMISLVLSINESLMQLEILGMVIGLNILCAIWLFFDRKSTEI